MTYWLVTMHVTSGSGHGNYMHNIVTSVEDLMAEVQAYEDEVYILINQLQVSPEFANRWQGAMGGM